MKYTPLPRGNCRQARELATDDADRMEERKFIGVLVGLEGGFVHQSANGEVRHYESVEFLANQVGRLAAQDDFGTAQMSFEFGERSFDFPPLMIKRRQFFGGSLVGIENGGHEPVDRLSRRFMEFRRQPHRHFLGRAGVAGGRSGVVRRLRIGGRTANANWVEGLERQ